MSFQLYNTLTRKKETFKPVNPEVVRIYVCGPTVNDVPHLGHAMSQVTFDTLRRYLEFIGYKVKFVSNITDIDDKIINKAKELGIKIDELTAKNEKAHIEDYSALGVRLPDVRTHATEYVKEMVALISLLYEKGYAYTIEGDGVYFDISKFKGYGKLSHQKVENLKKGARVAVKEGKKNKEDFALWKFSKSGEPSWESPWGSGRPGWHIECSAMSKTVLDLPIDIHGGGQDLIFPHHEDELAQSEAGYGVKFANYWMHNGMVNVDKVKMSKSLGNFKTIRDLLKSYHPRAIRYFVLSTHYRAPVDFSKKNLDVAQQSYERMKRSALALEDDGKVNEKVLEEFRKAMSDDMNCPKALAVAWGLIRDSKIDGKKRTLMEIDKVFALDLFTEEKEDIPAEVKALIAKREEARKSKDWKSSDELRQEIQKLGYSIEDNAKGAIATKL